MGVAVKMGVAVGSGVFAAEYSHAAEKAIISTDRVKIDKTEYSFLIPT
jgi:hypothetical protein